MAHTIAMIPARLGSQRLKQKNLLDIAGEPMIVHNIRKAKSLNCFDEIYVNSEADIFGEIALREGVKFHKRPELLGGSDVTSEHFVYEFLQSHPCDYLVQIHSIAPLLKVSEIKDFTNKLTSGSINTLLSGTLEQIQCLYEDKPVNFSFELMNATQELLPVQKITWSLTGWNAKSYKEKFEAGECATFHGNIKHFPITRTSGIVVKVKEDYELVKKLFEAGYSD